jgi:hypothetical protein
VPERGTGILPVTSRPDTGWKPVPPPDSPQEPFTVLDESQALDGGAVLPGLVIPLRELFERASRRRGPGA